MTAAALRGAAEDLGGELFGEVAILVGSRRGAGALGPPVPERRQGIGIVLADRLELLDPARIAGGSPVRDLGTVARRQRSSTRDPAPNRRRDVLAQSTSLAARTAPPRYEHVRTCSVPARSATPRSAPALSRFGGSRYDVGARSAGLLDARRDIDGTRRSTPPMRGAPSRGAAGRRPTSGRSWSASSASTALRVSPRRRDLLRLPGGGDARGALGPAEGVYGGARGLRARRDLRRKLGPGRALRGAAAAPRPRQLLCRRRQPRPAADHDSQGRLHSALRVAGPPRSQPPSSDPRRALAEAAAPPGPDRHAPAARTHRSPPRPARGRLGRRWWAALARRRAPRRGCRRRLALAARRLAAGGGRARPGGHRPAVRDAERERGGRLPRRRA